MCPGHRLTTAVQYWLKRVGEGRGTVGRGGALGAERLHAAGIAGRMLLRAGRSRLQAVPLAIAALIAAALPAAAQDATWDANPGSNLYNAFANWTPSTV